MPRPIHFEIHAANPERAMTFYRELLGWQFTKWDGPWPYWLIKTGEPGQMGIDGGLMSRQGGAPLEGAAVNAFVCTVDTPSVDDTLTKLQQLGGTVALPKMALPGMGWLAYGKDPEGNIFGCMQMDPSAK
jgi:hypothetical protein